MKTLDIGMSYFKVEIGWKRWYDLRYPGSFSETLVQLMKDKKLSAKKLADGSLVSEKTIQRLRKDGLICGISDASSIRRPDMVVSGRVEKLFGDLSRIINKGKW